MFTYSQSFLCGDSIHPISIQTADLKHILHGDLSVTCDSLHRLEDSIFRTEKMFFEIFN